MNEGVNTNIYINDKESRILIAFCSYFNSVLKCSWNDYKQIFETEDIIRLLTYLEKLFDIKDTHLKNLLVDIFVQCINMNDVKVFQFVSNESFILRVKENEE